MIYTIKLSGMMCSGCENRVTTDLANEFNATNITANHKTGTATFETDKDIPKSTIKDVIEALGYDFLSVEKS